MRLTKPFLRVPFLFDVARLRTEVAQFGPAEWRPHPQGNPGNWALPLIAVGGDVADEGVAGPMQPTPHLGRCPYIRQVMNALGVPLGRSRLMKLDARAEATPHVDINYYWMQRVRIHVPVETFAEVRFLCGDASIQMPAGECWIFDTWRRHNVLNPTPNERIHLVIDSVGSDTFWSCVHDESAATRSVPFDAEVDPGLTYERVNFPSVMSPWELESAWSAWLVDAQCGESAADSIAALVVAAQPTLMKWRALWARYGDHAEGWPHFAQCIDAFARDTAPVAGVINFPNGTNFGQVIKRSLIPAMHTPSVRSRNVASSTHIPDLGQVPQAPAVSRPSRASRFERPLIVLAAPRSGSSLLFETLLQSPDVYSVGGESHRQFESIEALRPETHGYISNRLSADDAASQVVAEVQQQFWAHLRDRDGAPPGTEVTTVRLLEKTPKNALRIPFLEVLFPDALYVYLHRDPRENLSSLIEGWESGRFVMYRNLPRWSGLPWSYLLTPGWRDLIGAPLAAIVAEQWRATQQILLDDLERLPASRVFALDYRDFLSDPDRHAREICAFAGLGWDRALPNQLPLSKHTVTPPALDKWKRHEAVLAPYFDRVADVAARARAFVAKTRAAHVADTAMPPSSPSLVAAIAKEASVPDTRTNSAAGVAAAPVTPLSSVHTTNLPQILRELRCSMMVTTYQAGKLIVVRADGTKLNTHFVNFKKPMGLAFSGDRFFVGADSSIREFRNVPAVAAKVTSTQPHDAVFVQRADHVTGNIDIHEMAIADNRCLYVNTLFSCLCTHDANYSFVPVWRPHFISGLAPEDRCHLNGVAMVDGKPRFLTALGESDQPRGWRANKKDGGILIDYASGETVSRGLSMPHSPRWYRNRLWVLESGKGLLSTVDPVSGKTEAVARVPGFTRGLDFIGPLAFIGLSQLRETNAFTDIPITEDNSDRMSGVWVVNIESGTTIAFLKFSDAVHEIFAVQILPGMLFPAIVDDQDELIRSTYVLPDAALREVRFSTAIAESVPLPLA